MKFYDNIYIGLHRFIKSRRPYGYDFQIYGGPIFILSFLEILNSIALFDSIKETQKAFELQIFSASAGILIGNFVYLSRKGSFEKLVNQQAYPNSFNTDVITIGAVFILFCFL